MKHPPEESLVLAIDIAAYTPMDEVEQRSTQELLRSRVEHTAHVMALSVTVHAHGEGLLISAYPRDSAVEYGARLLKELNAPFTEENGETPPLFRLRIGLAYGQVARSDIGFAGHAVIEATRLADSETLRRSLDNGPVNLAWTSSQVLAERVLHHDPSLRSGYVQQPFRPQKLPSEVQGFLGREDELSILDKLMRRKGRRTAAIVGPGGSGKSSLATHWAHRTSKAFRDGQIHVDVAMIANAAHQDSSTTLSNEALKEVLRALGVLKEELAADLDSNLGTYQAMASSRHLLVVLDDLPPDFDHNLVRQLAIPGPMVIVCARQLKTGFYQASEISLGPLPHEAALRILRAKVGEERFSRAKIADWAALVTAAAALPLAVAILGGLLTARAALTPKDLLKQIDTRENTTDNPSLRATFELAYELLSAEASAVLRAASLSDAGDVSPEMLAFLLNKDSGEVAPHLAELQSLGMLFVRTDGVVDLHSLIREFTAQKLASEQPPAEVEQLRERINRYFLLQFGRAPNPEPKIARDFWTIEDQLSHQRYADAIAAFVRHRETRPPLTIGIKAPWGAGKTSLMRMIQDNLDPGAGTEPLKLRLTSASRSRVARWRRGDTSPSSRVTNRELFYTAEHTDNETAEPIKARLDPGVPTNSDWRPTVWFNPWMYQNGEQVWAGLAHEIISQVTSRLSVGDRERFWLRLNLARIDRETVRQKWYRLLLSRVLPLVGIWIATLLVAVVALLWVWLLPSAQEAVARWISTSTITGGTLVLIVGGLLRLRSYLRDPASGSLGSLVAAPDPLGTAFKPLVEQAGSIGSQAMTDPGYTARVGFLHLVQTDMRRVLDLIADEERPLVVFIDDLDRCSSGTVAQVIEAINLFLAGQFPNCVFIAGMDPGAVAAHVEVSNQDLVTAEREGRFAKDLSTLGWRFLGKFVQLPLSLPSTRDEQDVQGYLQALMGIARTTNPTTVPPSSEASAPDANTEGDQGESPTEPTPSRTPSLGSATHRSAKQLEWHEIDALTAAIRRRNPTLDNLRSVTLEAQREVLDQPAPLTPAALRAADRVFGNLYRDTDSEDVLTAGVAQLATSNPREIKRYVNLFRFYMFISQRHRLEGLSALAPDQAAKLAALTIRWPHVLSLLHHPGGVHPVALLERAARAENDEAWGKAMAEAAPSQAKNPACSWSDPLRSFLSAGPELGSEAARLV